MTTKITQLGINELHQAFRENPVPIFADAYKKGMNLSAWLERLNPSEKGEQLDAFGRLLKAQGIVPTSNPEMGYWASPAEDFLKDKASRALLNEFFARTWRKVAYGSVTQRATYLAGDGTPGSWQRPYYDAMDPRWSQEVAPAIPLSEIVAITTPIEGQDYRAFYLTYSAEQVRLFRLGESAEIPIAKLADAERTITLKKYGRGLRASYEQMRRMRVDKLALHIRMMAVQAEVDKVSAAIYILINGDGNSGTSATTHDLTTLDTLTPAVAGTLTMPGWLNFKKQFPNPYILTTALMPAATALQLEMLNMGSGNVALVQLQGSDIIGSIRPINMTSDAVRYGWTSDVAALTILGFDNRRAIEQLVEIGGDIAETERFITNQTEVMTMTEVQGFAILDPTCNLILDVNA
jgi:hypothetical protein